MYYNKILQMNGDVENDYKLVKDIFRNKEVWSDNQEQTSDTFSYKWKKRDTYESDSIQDMSTKWLMERYFEGDSTQLHKYIWGGTKFFRCGLWCRLFCIVAFWESVE